MKQKMIALLCLPFVIALFASCAENQGASVPLSTNGTEPSSTQSPETTEADEVLESNPYFELRQKDWQYSYEIYDQEGNVIASGDPSHRCPRIKMVDDVLIRITTQAGTGLTTQTGYFCNVETGERSKVFSCVFDQCNGLVAYAQSDKIVVESIFHDSFYREIVDFQNPFSPVAFPFENAEFINEGASLRIAYLTGDDYESVSEEFRIEEGSGDVSQPDASHNCLNDIDVICKEEKNYKILSNQESTIHYPRLEGTDRDYTAVNTLIRESVDAWLAENVAEDAVVTLDYSITFQDDTRLGLLFDGMANSQQAAHPVRIVYGLCISLTDEKVIDPLKTLEIDDKLIEKFRNGLPQAREAADFTGDQWQDVMNLLSSYSDEDLRRPIENGQLTWQENGILIAIAVPHAIGDYITVAIDDMTTAF